MANCIIMGGGGGGTLSSDVTATKANVLAGTKTVTSDSNNEVVDGTMVNRGTVNQTIGINGSYTIPQGYHSGSGKVSQSVATKAAATYRASTSDQTIAANQWLSGAQTIKAVTQSGLAAGNIKNGVTVTVSSNGANLYSVTGNCTGTKTAISATAYRGFGLSSRDFYPSEEASFTMPQNGVVYYGGVSAFYGATGTGTVEIYKNGVLIDNRNGADGYAIRTTMVNKSFAASRNDVITVKATATAGNSVLCMIQAVCIY